jgi:LmbE family N-acetylglucosaminyl deacetylase
MELTRAAIVVSHPDDEILWFGSIVAKVGRVIIIHGDYAPTPERGPGRRRAIEAYPLQSVAFLDLPEPGEVRADAEPELTRELAARLREALDGFQVVFTHNAWGEYGHADHRRAHAAVMSLSAEMAFTVYVSGYLGPAAIGRFEEETKRRFVEVVSFETDREPLDAIRDLYKRHDCWTWVRDWAWPREEHFLRVGPGAPLRRATIPLHFICQ